MERKDTDLERARKLAQKRAAESPMEEALPLPDLTAAECLVQLLVSSYAYGLTYGLGAMQDGSALWLRIRVPKSSDDPHAGMVSFVVDQDPTILLQKALLSLEAKPESRWWKPDQFASG